MRLPFGREEFLEVFATYNRAVWPAPVLLTLMAITAVGLLLGGRGRAGRWAAGILAGLWLWAGIAYHLVFFRRINPAAVVFGIAFVVQGMLFAGLAVGPGLRPGKLRGLRGTLAAGLLAYAFLFYPAIAMALGHRFPAMPTFGLPCPTTIFTWGVLVLAPVRPPWFLLVVPAGWALLGVSAALGLGIWEDLGLAVAGACGIAAAALTPRAAREETA